MVRAERIDVTEFIVSMDLKDHRGHRIHRTSCRWYLRHLDDMKSGILSPTTSWHGPYPSEEEARQNTHVNRVCLECSPLTNAPSEEISQRGVVVTDIDIPFSRIMAIVFQWALASLIWYVILAVITVVIVMMILSPTSSL